MIIHDDIQLIRDRIAKARNIAVFAHVRPDGDSIGSTLALGWALEDMGKKVQLISEDPVPDRFHFLFQFTKDGKNPYQPEPVDADCYTLERTFGFESFVATFPIGFSKIVHSQ